MGETRTLVGIDPAYYAFARQLYEVDGARPVLLLPAYGGLYTDEDDDDMVIVVSPTFVGVKPLVRPHGLKRRYYALGGDRPFHLECLTPDEFESARTRPTAIAAVLPEAIDLLAPPAAEPTA